MNFLAHTALVGSSEALRLGALLGDFVKVPLVPTPVGFSREQVAGIQLHRSIDSYLDAHVVSLRSRQRVSPRYRRVAGIMMDVFYDHFLAKHWAQFYELPLERFAQDVYDLLDQHEAILPERLNTVRRYMREGDWLVSYRDVAAIHLTLDRLSRRLSKPDMLTGAGQELEANYAALEDDFFLIYADMQRFVGERIDSLGWEA